MAAFGWRAAPSNGIISAALNVVNVLREGGRWAKNGVRRWA
jgi:hypothetical protein